MQPGYVTIQSTSGNKEWFNICLYNNIGSDIINRSLLSQSVNYQVDDGPWESFEVPYNHYLTRHVVYGYQVTLADYQVVKEENNFSYGKDSVYNSTPFTLYTQSEYVAYGDVFTNGLIDIEINEIDDMTAQELLGYIRSLQDEVSSLKNMLSTYATYSTVVNLYATKDYVQSQKYLTYQNLNGYATEKYVNNKLSSYATIAYMQSQNYLTEHQDLSSYATKDYVQSQNYLTYHQSLDGYATKSYVLNKVNSINPITYNVSYTTNEVDLTDYATESYVLDKVNSINPITYNVTYDVVKIDNKTIISKDGNIYVETKNLAPATPYDYGVICFDNWSIGANPDDNKLEVKRFQEIEALLVNNPVEHASIREDIVDLTNRTIKLEIEAFSENIEFLSLINGDYYELPQPVYDPLTYTVINTSLDKTISCQIKTNCKYKVDIEYKENSNKYNQVTLKSVQVGNSEIIPGNDLVELVFEETGKRVQTLNFIFNVKNYNMDDNTESINTEVIITTTSINDDAIYQKIKYTFKCWNNNTFDGIIQDSYATESYVGSYIESKNYATKSYVLDKVNSINPITYNVSYTTNEVDLTNYATEEYIQSYIESKNYLTEHQSLDNYVTKNQLNNAGYISSISDDYATKTYVATYIESKNYLTEHQSLNDYASKTFVQEQLEHVTQDTYVTRVSYNTYQADLTNYATKSYVGDYFTGHINNYATKSYVVSYLESQHYLTEHQNIEDMASQSYVNSYVSSYIDLYMSLNNYVNDIQINNYATKSYVLNKVSQYPTYAYLNNLINGIETYNVSYQLDNNSVIDLSDYVSKSYFNNIVAQLTEDINDLIAMKDYKGPAFLGVIETELKSINLYTVNQLSNLDLQSLCSINNLNCIELYEIEPIYLYGLISRLRYIDTLYAQNSTYQIIASSVEHVESLDNMNNITYSYIYLKYNHEYRNTHYDVDWNYNNGHPAYYPGVISNNTIITNCIQDGAGGTRTFKSGYDNFILCTYNYNPSELPNYKQYLGGIVVENSYITYLFVPSYVNMSNNELESMVSMYNTWLNSAEMESFINDNKYINLYFNHNAISSNDFAEHYISEVIQEIAAIYNPEYEGPTEEPNN